MLAGAEVEYRGPKVSTLDVVKVELHKCKLLAARKELREAIFGNDLGMIYGCIRLQRQRQPNLMRGELLSLWQHISAWIRQQNN